MPITLLWGDNALEIDEAVNAVRMPFEAADVVTLDGSTVSLDELSQACLTAGLFDPQRLVVVNHLHERKAGKQTDEADRMDMLFGAMPDTTTLLLICKEMKADHHLSKVVRASGGTVRGYQTPRKGDLARWVSARGPSHGVRLDPAAAEMLADLAGSDTLQLDSELEKLATYAGEEAVVTPEMVEILVSHVTQETIFALVDAVAGGNRASALRLLRTQMEAASSTQTDFALYLIRMLTRQTRILLRIRVGREEGRSAQQLTAELKLPRYYADRYFRQANRLATPRLMRTFEQMASLEHRLKTGTADAGTGLDLLVTDLCA